MHLWNPSIFCVVIYVGRILWLSIYFMIGLCTCWISIVFLGEMKDYCFCRCTIQNIKTLWSGEDNHQFVKVFLLPNVITHGGKFMRSCTLYFISKSTDQMLGKYIPLPVLSSPCESIAINLIVGLTTGKEMTIIY